MGFVGAVKETSPARSMIVTLCAGLTLKSSTRCGDVPGRLGLAVFFTIRGDCCGLGALSPMPAFDGGAGLGCSSVATSGNGLELTALLALFVDAIVEFCNRFC